MSPWSGDVHRHEERGLNTLYNDCRIGREALYVAFRAFFNPWSTRGKGLSLPGSTIVVMVTRDPSTGRFVAGDEFDDVEVVTFTGSAGIEAANNDGTTSFTGEFSNFEGIQLVDYDNVVDRNEDLQLLYAAHRLAAYPNSTETEDGTLVVSAEVSGSPSRGSATTLISTSTVDDPVVGSGQSGDSIDIIGRPLLAMAGAPFSDTTTGVGGAGSGGHDQYESDVFPAEMGQFHPRDELFLNGQIRTFHIDDAGVHLTVQGQHVYGVRSD